MLYPILKKLNMLNEDVVAMVLLKLRRELIFRTISALYFDISKSRVEEICNFILPLLAKELTADGTIMFVLRPFGCEKDDKIFQRALSEGLKDWLEGGDVVYLDRGFRMANHQVPYDVIIQRPHYLHKRSQFSSTEHDESVAVLQIQFVIENVNTRLKHFKLISNVYPNKD
jgi:hypothetical protein